MSSLGERLNLLRKQRDLKAEELATAIGVQRRVVFHYEKNEVRPGYDTLIHIADFFDVSLDYLVGRSDDPRRH